MGFEMARRERDHIILAPRNRPAKAGRFRWQDPLVDDPDARVQEAGKV